jgi:Anti-sigma factor NepR
MADDDTRARKPNRPAKKTMTSTAPAASKPQISDIIGRRLRTYYDEVAAQPVPERFLDLLEQLEAKSRPKKAD